MPRKPTLRRGATGRFVSKEIWKQGQKIKKEYKAGKKSPYLNPPSPKKQEKRAELFDSGHLPKPDFTYRYPPTAKIGEGYLIYRWVFHGLEGQLAARNALMAIREHLLKTGTPAKARFFFGVGQGKTAEWFSTKTGNLLDTWHRATGLRKTTSGEKVFALNRAGEPLFFVVEIIVKGNTPLEFYVTAPKRNTSRPNGRGYGKRKTGRKVGGTKPPKRKARTPRKPNSGNGKASKRRTRAKR